MLVRSQSGLTSLSMLNFADCGRCHMEKNCWPDDCAAAGGVSVERQPTVRDGTFLWRQGAPLRELMLVRHGCVKIYESAADGSERVLQFALPGDLLGLEALASGRHDSHAIALGDVLLCRITDSDDLELKSEGLQRRLLWRASALLRERTRAVRLADPDASLHGFLQELSQRIGRRNDQAHAAGIAVRLPMSRREIGQYLGYAEETVCRSLRRLQRRGLVQVRGRDLQLLPEPQEALEQLATG